MKKQSLCLFSILAFVILSFSVNAQSNPPSILYFYIYSTNGQEYFGKYWPENTNINEAIAMDQAAKNDNSANMRLFEGCEDLKLRIMLNRSVPEDTTIYIKLRFFDLRSEGGLNAREVVDLPDSIRIPPGVTLFEYPYRIHNIPENGNGGKVRIEGYTSKPDGSEHSQFGDNANFYSPFTYDIQFREKEEFLDGSFSLKVTNATPQVVCSFDGGYTWKSALPDDGLTYKKLPYSDLEKALESGVVYIKEPNSCHLVAIPIKSREPEGAGSIVVNRSVMIETEDGLTTLPRAGLTHYTPSWKDFTFKVYGEPGKELLITTNRAYDNEGGVKIVPTGEGAWDVTIVKVHSSLKIKVAYKTSIENGDNPTGNTVWVGYNVWSANGKLHVKNANPGTLSIFTITGQLYKTIEISGDYSESLPRGLYIVKLNGKTYKITL